VEAHASAFGSRERRLAERVGFEPTCRLPDKTLSRRPRYDHFGTSPFGVIRVQRTPHCIPRSPDALAAAGPVIPRPLRVSVIGSGSPDVARTATDRSTGNDHSSQTRHRESR
jgi:hypothetical protein